jgi:hypothetical protein
MSSQCVFNDKGVQCPEMVDTGLFCTKHAGVEQGKPYTADETPAKKEGGGGGGGGGGWSILGRTGVVYQKEK